jgi:uncharacterized membrane protein YbhN (UPF0104 family)
MQDLSSNIPVDTSLSKDANIGDASIGARSWWRSMIGSHRARLVASLATLVLLIVALAVVVISVSLAEIWSQIQQARPEWICLTILLLGLSQSLRLLRSVRLLSWETRPNTRNGLQAITGGQVINWLSPIRVGDMWRIWRVGRGGRGGNTLLWAASSVVLEKGADSLVLAMFAGLLLISPLSPGVSAPLVRLLSSVFGCVMLLSAISAISSSRLRNRLLQRLPRFDHLLNRTSVGPLGSLFPEKLNALHHPLRWMELFGYTTALWTIGIAINVALAQAMGIHIGLTTQLLLTLTLQTTIVVAPVPGNIGVFPLVSLGVLSAVGVNSAQALAFGSLLYVCVNGVLLFMAAIAFAPGLRLNRLAVSPAEHAASD